VTETVNWFENDVLLAVERATDRLLTALAFQGEALAATNAPSAKPGFDTGFMRAAIYGVGPTGSHRDEARGKAQALADRELAPAIDLEEHTAGIHAAAEYTVYWETRFGFLYRAIEELQGMTDGVIREVARGGLR